MEPADANNNLLRPDLTGFKKLPDLVGNLCLFNDNRIFDQARLQWQVSPFLYPFAMGYH